MDIIDELAQRARAMRQARYYRDSECLTRAAGVIESLRSELARLDPSRDATRIAAHPTSTSSSRQESGQ